MTLQDFCGKVTLKRRKSKTVLAVPGDDLLHRAVAKPTNAVVQDQQLPVELAGRLGLDLLRCAQLFDPWLLSSILRRAW